MKHLFSLIVGLSLMFKVSTSSALPIVSVDMDPTTMGIQSTLIVAPSSTFTVDVVIADDGMPVSPTFFDTVILETFFNDVGAVLTPGPTGPTWGALAASFTDIDLFGGFPTPGLPAGVGPSSAPAGGFAGGSGAIGLANFVPFVLFPAPPISIFSIDFMSTGLLGTSAILAAGTGPFGSPELSFGGAPVPALLAGGTVTVASAAVPEPATMSLLGLGLVGLVALRSRKFSGYMSNLSREKD